MKKVLTKVIGLATVLLPGRVKIRQAKLDLCRDKSRQRPQPSILMENGFSFLLENGKRLLMEKDGTKSFDVPSKPCGVLLLENGSRLCLENGCAIILE